MSTDGRTLAGYVRELVARLGAADPDALARLRAVVADRRARIALDGEAVEVAFRAGTLEVARAPTGHPLDGSGTTDSRTVLDLLDGTLEVTDAVLTGRLHVEGPAGAVADMFQAIGIILDATARVPALRHLADEFRQRRGGRPPAGPGGPPTRPRPPADGAAPQAGGAAPPPDDRAVSGAGETERELLARLGLLPPPCVEPRATPP